MTVNIDTLVNGHMTITLRSEISHVVTCVAKKRIQASLNPAQM